MESKVYFTREITPEKVVELYYALGVQLPGKVAVKVHSGEKGNQNFLRPEFWRPMVEEVHGTVVECNTAYGDAAGGEQYVYHRARACRHPFLDAAEYAGEIDYQLRGQRPRDGLDESEELLRAHAADEAEHRDERGYARYQRREQQTEHQQHGRDERQRQRYRGLYVAPAERFGNRFGQILEIRHERLEVLY